MKISKRRMEILKEYGVLEQALKNAAPKRRGRPRVVPKKAAEAPIRRDVLTPAERKESMRLLEESVHKACRKKDKERELAELRRADRECDVQASYEKVDHALVPPHRLGQMSATQAKRRPRGRWQQLAAEPAAVINTNLISRHPDTGVLSWHGDVCVHCGSPPTNMGEAILAEYGATEFICTDCGKHMPHLGTGLRGLMSGEVYRARQKKMKPTPKWRMPIIHTYQKEEEEQI